MLLVSEVYFPWPIRKVVELNSRWWCVFITCLEATEIRQEQYSDCWSRLFSLSSDFVDIEPMCTDRATLNVHATQLSRWFTTYVLLQHRSVYSSQVDVRLRTRVPGVASSAAANSNWYWCPSFCIALECAVAAKFNAESTP